MIGAAAGTRWIAEATTERLDLKRVADRCPPVARYDDAALDAVHVGTDFGLDVLRAAHHLGCTARSAQER